LTDHRRVTRWPAERAWSAGEIEEKERTGILRRRTRRVGQFEFRVVLPEAVDRDNIDADLDDGVLAVCGRTPTGRRPGGSRSAAEAGRRGLATAATPGTAPPPAERVSPSLRRIRRAAARSPPRPVDRALSLSAAVCDGRAFRHPDRRRPYMADSVYRVTEVIGTSTESWEAAARSAVATAAGTIRDIRVAEVVRQDVTIENGQITSYRVRLDMSFKYETGD
jgi:dodecin